MYINDATFIKLLHDRSQNLLKTVLDNKYQKRTDKMTNENGLEHDWSKQDKPHPLESVVRAIAFAQAKLTILNGVEYALDKKIMDALTTLREYMAKDEQDLDWLTDATSIFEEIVYLYPNQDMSHVDFRVHVAKNAEDFLSHNHIEIKHRLDNDERVEGLAEAVGWYTKIPPKHADSSLAIILKAARIQLKRQEG